MTVETLYLYKPRVGVGGQPHHGLDLRKLRAGVAIHRRRLRDPAGGVGVGWWTR
ncbi:uncharacterized protein DS421_20g693080 [Arachis hypogaea]|nr:uncharacterized protein DS421_20g693080 [Arachis hypogaea]